ncbi:hybrid sensor histidine kinase/response regulator [Haloarcula salina]|uniref:histidine kinase n=1 Tax=Haloarcula salina TaxID=1429914 RepID=A0AA41G1I5_9EURY|nr:PAS domain-containing protein [Haloarcula salina]MBV0902526.1 PAS domain-containing protein [Haloarcula salina]
MSPPETGPAERPSVESSADRIRVLYVDEPEHGDRVESYLEGADGRFEVSTATDSSEARTRLAERDVDCVVSDDRLPGESGVEFLRRVREDYPELPFVLFAGNGSEAVASEAIAAGVTDYLPRDGADDRYAVLAERVRDAVERYRTEQAAAATERWLRRGCERVTDGFLVLNRSWAVQFVNGAGAAQLGVARDAVVGQRLWDAVPELRGTPVEDALRSAATSVDPTTVETDCGPLDGWYTVTAYPDADGLSVFLRDTTERKRRERELEATRERYEGLVEAFPNGGVFLFDEDCRFTAAGGVDLTRVGLSEEHLLGRRPSEVFPPENAALLESAYEAALDGERRSFEDSFIGRYYHVQTFPIRDSDGDIVSGMAVAQNITDRKEREERLRRQNERLETFARFVSHDLRNPLSVLQGALYLAEETGEPQHFDRCQSAVERMEQLIDGLLAMATDGEEADMSVAAVSLADCTRNCWQTLDTAGATLVADTDLTVEANYVRFRQLLENLLQNALDHGRTASNGDGAVTVTVGALDDGSGFFVADDGPGVADDIRGEAFDLGRSSVEDGTGLGLAIGKQIVEDHGWDIRVTESADGGARFEVSGVTVVE